jgi:hypothetical protein
VILHGETQTKGEQFNLKRDFFRIGERRPSLCIKMMHTASFILELKNRRA